MGLDYHSLNSVTIYFLYQEYTAIAETLVIIEDFVRAIPLEDSATEHWRYQQIKNKILLSAYCHDLIDNKKNLDKMVAIPHQFKRTAMDKDHISIMQVTFGVPNTQLNLVLTGNIKESVMTLSRI